MKVLKKIKNYIKVIKNLLNQEVNKLTIQENPSIWIKSLQKRGVDIADDVLIAHINTIYIDLTRPSLITIKGNGTRLNKGLEILTHDYATMVMINKYDEFCPSSGKVYIGENVYIGRNVTLLKGTHIGNNCIIGYNSVVMGKIPDNSVAVGCPAKVICSLEDYYKKRKIVCVEEAFEYARSIKERYNRMPIPSDFWEEFPLFVSGNEVDKYPEIPIKRQLGKAYDNWSKEHKADFNSFDEFLKAAGLK